MKIKKIGQLCKDAKMVVVFDVPDGDGVITQWIGDGHALYPIYNLPYLEEKALQAVWEIPDKKWEKMIFEKVDGPPESLNLSDTDPGERMVEGTHIAIGAAGALLLPLVTRDGIVFIDSKYRGPLSDMDVTLEMYERTTPGGGTYIALKSGYILWGVVMQNPVITEDFIKEMESILARCRVSHQLNKTKAGAAAARDPQQTEMGDKE